MVLVAGQVHEQPACVLVEQRLLREYTALMDRVGMRELKQNPRAVIERVEHGASVEITLQGRAVARMSPITHRRKWTPAADVPRLLNWQASAQTKPAGSRSTGNPGTRTPWWTRGSRCDPS